jgi:hypothetical protein
MKYITTATTTTLPVSNGLLVQVNAALAAGTITINDAGVAVAIITNPTVGTSYRYYGFNGAITIVTNAICDITVSSLNTTR